MEEKRVKFRGLLWIYTILAAVFLLKLTNNKSIKDNYSHQIEYFKYNHAVLQLRNHHRIREKNPKKNSKSKLKNTFSTNSLTKSEVSSLSDNQMCENLNGCRYKINITRAPTPMFGEQTDIRSIKLTGLPFDITPKIYKLMKTYLNTESIPTSNRISHPESVQPITGLSSNHYSEFMKNIHNADKFFSKTKKIVVYDIGLEPYQANNLQGKKYIYRKLDFERYPEHVAELLTFAFKWACIFEGLIEFGSVMWFDTSIRFPGNDKFDNLIHSKVSKKLEANITPADIQFYVKPASHSIASATFKQMLDFIPSNIDNLAENHMMQAGAVLIYNTEQLKQNVLKWAYFCILTKFCIAPETLWNAEGRVSEKDKWCPPRIKNFKRELAYYRAFGADYGEDGILFACHRGDQSMISILVVNFYGTKMEGGLDKFYEKFASVQRVMT